MDVTLTDGGIETRIIYEFKRPIGEFNAEVTVRHGLPIQLGTPTWRAA